MTKEAFAYALSHAPVPSGRGVWIYHEPLRAGDDAYSPFHGAIKKAKNTFHDIDAVSRNYDAVFVACPKNRDETEGLIALALSRTKGFVMCVAPNNANGNRLGRMCEAYGVSTGRLAKAGCKIVWMEAGKANTALIREHMKLLEPRELVLEGMKFFSVPGLFGWDKLDEGSRLLAEHLPQDIAGKAADFGCGWGYLSMLLAAREKVLAIDAIDCDRRAVNMAAMNGGGRVTPIWQDVTTMETRPVYDTIVMNPPFHTGHENDVELGKTFIRKAWESLKPGGRLFMVANRQLPYEAVQGNLRVVAEGNGYKIMVGKK